MYVTPKYRNKAKGCLWGICVGDCLGDYLQFGPPVEDRRDFVVEMKDGGPFSTPKGYWTDDFAMALSIMRTTVANRGWYRAKDIAEGFRRWLRKGWCSSLDHAFDVGFATMNAISNYETTGSLKNGDEGTQGNGSLMRHAPAYFIGLSLGSVKLISHEISDITHNSSVVRESVDRLNRIIESNLNGTKTDIFGRYVTDGVPADRKMVRNGGWCVDTLDSALWAFHSTKSFESALVAAVNNGHDADSVGAVCGQIAGSFYGYDAIPRLWIETVKNWRAIDDSIEDFLNVIFEKEVK